MKIIALGTGSAFCMKNWQTNFLIERCGRKMLIDAGSDIRWSLQEQGLSYLDIDAVYVSHAHADHIGGLEYLGFTSFFDPRWKQAREKLPRMGLFCERGLVRLLWDHSLRGGMEGLEGVDARIDTYFDVIPVDKNKSFSWCDIKFDIVQSVHISAKYCIVDSFGVMFTDPDNDTRVYLTTDVQFAPETSMKAYYREADLIIHDCETLYKSGVHAHYDQLSTLPDEIKAKMLLTHYQDNVVADFETWQAKARNDGFLGFAEKGVIYDTEANQLPNI
jgi:ribonuclease BN (tRNA processing enzyme)